MATLAPSTSPPSSPPSFNFRRKSWARRLERCCCNTLAYFPLTFVYGLTTWAVYVETNVSFLDDSSWYAYFKAGLGLLLYGILNVSYTIAVFTSAGSPLDPRQDWSRGRGKNGRPGAGYEGLPTHEHHDEDGDEDGDDAQDMTTVTAKSSTGKPRYCKKCNTVKPDRTHHCSTCGRCVLKMDHHCPWLATCVGLHNYKPFLLFLAYTSLFCWLCFGVSASWVWAAITESQQNMQDEGMRVVNSILLAVLGGIIGLVLGGFTAWHIYLAVTGQTTIESLEKTRYLSPLKKSMERQQFSQSNRHYLHQQDEEAGNAEQGEEQEQSLLEHLKETHANALPGVLRPEEGEVESQSRSLTPQPPQPSFHASPSPSPAKSSLQSNYAHLEAQRERDRYASYLDEQDSEKLPNAFDLGWKRNLRHVFGEQPWFWLLPVCNTSGDGWAWEVSPDWTDARSRVAREREARAREEAMWERESGGRQRPAAAADWRWMPGQGFVDRAAPPPPPPPPAQQQQYSYEGPVVDGGRGMMQMQPLDRRKRDDDDDDGGVDSYDTSSDEDAARSQQATRNWNDVPEDFLAPGRAGRSRGTRRKGD